MVNKKEIKYISYSVGFAILYFFFILPYLVERFDGNNPLLQFFIFNIGIMTFLTIYLKSRTLGSGIELMKSLEYLFVVMAVDIWLPEYHVGFLTGELVTGASLGISTTDYIFGYIAHNTLNLSGILVSIFVYAIVPAALLYLAARVSSSNFIRRI